MGSVHEKRFESFRLVEAGFELGGGGIDDLAEGGAVAEAFGHELAFDAAFVLKQEAGASFVIEVNAAVTGFEVGSVEDLMGEEVEGESFGEDGSEGFHEIEGERPAVVLSGVKQAEGWVETDSVEGSSDFVVEECGAEGEAGIDRVEGWACGTPAEGESGRQEGSPDLKVAGGGGSFESAEFVERVNAGAVR
jgi:hypothetical protein